MKIIKALTTGQVAEALSLSPRTVSKAIDRGDFEGSYRIPGSKDRRVPQWSVKKYIEDNGMNLDNLKAVLIKAGLPLYIFGLKALFIGFDSLAEKRFRDAVTTHELHFYEDIVQGVAAFCDVSPSVIVVDFSIGKSAGVLIARTVRGRDNGVKTKIIAACEECDGSVPELTLAGYDDVVFYPLRYDLITCLVSK